MTAFLSNETPEAEEILLSLWPDAPTEFQLLCAMVLDVAKERVIAWASESEDDPDFTWANPPARMVYAQLLEAKNIWNEGRADGNGNIGPDGQPQFQFQPRPLSKLIRTIIRPQSGAADVF